MKYLMTSAAVAALALSFSAPAFADCTAEIAALRAQDITTGSIASPAAATIEEPATGGQVAAVEEMKPAEPAADVAAVDVAAPTASGSMMVVPDETAADATAIGPTAAISDATKEIATSPVEVADAPTAQPAETAPSAEQLANQATGGEQIVASASPTFGGEPVNMTEVLAARAEAYKNLGNEAACLNVIEQAKTM
jgi:hypothetical protein